MYVYIVIGVGWLLWLTPFFRYKRGSAPAQKTDRRARWGIVLEMLGYSLLWQGRFWERTPALWQLTLGVFFFASAILFSWSATPVLGKQWRVEASLSADHQLVTGGPYRIIRHPIYASMFSIFLAIGSLVTSWWLFAIAAVIFVSGTEIRVRVEDGLLASRFGAEFESFRRRVPAYIPWVR